MPLLGNKKKKSRGWLVYLWVGLELDSHGPADNTDTHPAAGQIAAAAKMASFPRRI